MIAFVDEFILFDDMQYTKRDWRNRNRIKTSQGLQWLTVLVLSLAEPIVIECTKAIQRRRSPAA